VRSTLGRVRARWQSRFSLVLGLSSSGGVFLSGPALAEDARPAAKTRPAMPDALDRGGRGDAVYGRFDGPLALSLGAGLEVAGASGVARPAALASLRFYQTVGLAVGFAQAVAESDPLERSLATCVVVEPLFLLRWSADREWGRAFWDLTLDSLSLSLGAVIAEPRAGSFGDAAGFRLGLGAGLPLLGRANGPWLRLGGRMDTGLGESVEGSFHASLEWQLFMGNPRQE